MTEYNDQEVLMQYVRKNYRELFEKHPRVPSKEQFLAAIPEHLHDEYLARLDECREIRTAKHMEEERLGGWKIMVEWPTMSEELSRPYRDAHEAHDRLVFEEVLAAHSDEIVVLRCPSCSRIVMTPKARQCLWCGHDWH